MLTENVHYRICQPISIGREFQPLAPWSDEMTECFRSSGVDALGLFKAPFWKGSNLTFLPRLKGLRSLRIERGTACDVSPITQLSELEKLELNVVEGPTSPIDLLACAALRHLRFDWSPKINGWDQMRDLRFLGITKLKKTKEFDLTGFARLTGFELISSSQLERVVFDEAAGLTYLSLHYLPKLREVRGGPGWEAHVERLRLTSTKLLGSEFIQRFDSLRLLEIEKMGDIGVLRFNKRPENVLMLERGTKVKILPAPDAGGA
jgi:hypothetical protein